MPQIEIENFKLFYELKGDDGEPLILIPGFASGAWSWFGQVGELSKDCRVITFDPRGVAQSEIPDELTESVSIQTIAEDVAKLLDALEIEKAHILGASFGGFVAQEFALKFPERLSKLILACTSFGGAQHVLPNLDVLMAFASTEGLNSAERIRKFMRPAFTDEFLEKSPAEVEKVCRLREQNMVPERVYFQQLNSATAFDTEKRVGIIKAETLILTGDTDRIVPMQNSVNLAEKLPNAQLEIIKGGSHMFFVERADEFNKIVSQFVRG